MAFNKFRAFMDVGRVQGISTTAAIALLGAFTSTRAPAFGTLLWLVVISIYAHAGGAAINELWDRKLDAGVRELWRKPLISGALSVAEAKAFSAACIAVALSLAFIMFGFAAFIAILVSCIWLVWYCTSGKRTFLANDLALSVGYPAFALFGALAAGMPTFLTLVFLGIVAAVSAFSQWENGLKDADNDRRFGIPSLAVRSGVSSETGLAVRHPFFIYGAGIKLAFLALCVLPVLVMPVPFLYLGLVLILGVPDQLLTMRMFLGKRNRADYVKAILADVPQSWLVGSAIAILCAGWQVYAGLTVFLVAGYLVGSALQSGAEFKLRLPGSWQARRRSRARKVPVRYSGTPFMVTWAPRGKGGFVEVRSSMMAIRPRDPLPALDEYGERCDGVCIVEALN